jgi:hypothetical protein
MHCACLCAMGIFGCLRFLLLVLPVSSCSGTSVCFKEAAGIKYMQYLYDNFWSTESLGVCLF